MILISKARNVNFDETKFQLKPENIEDSRVSF